MKPVDRFVNGKWTTVCDLKEDLVISRGHGVFEALEARRTALFHWEDHYERLLASARRAHISSDAWPSEEDILKKIKKLLEYSGHAESVVKVIVTAGDSKNQWMPDKDCQPKILLFAFPLARVERPSLRLEIQVGIREFPEMKGTGMYESAKIRRTDAEFRGFDDFLYWDPWHGLTESALSNVFFITKGGSLITPADHILYGVTRKIILQIAESSNLFKEVRETRDLHLCMLKEVDEACLTSTTLGVKEIASITDFDEVHAFTVGADTKTARLQTLFLAYREDYYKNKKRDA